jgi:hypothetical protein
MHAVVVGHCGLMATLIARAPRTTKEETVAVGSGVESGGDLRGRRRRRAVGGVQTVPVGTPAFKARAWARGSAAMASGAARRRRADERARRGEREADRCCPATDLFRIKNTPEQK